MSTVKVTGGIRPISMSPINNGETIEVLDSSTGEVLLTVKVEKLDNAVMVATAEKETTVGTSPHFFVFRRNCKLEVEFICTVHGEVQYTIPIPLKTYITVLATAYDWALEVEVATL